MAARMMSERINPYPLIGFSVEARWNLLYPLTASSLTLPLALLSEKWATLLFVSISSGLLAFGLTRAGWWRLWILLSSPFVIAVMSAQWSPLICAAILMPELGFALAAKPTIGLAAAIRNASLIPYAIAGGLILLVVSLLFVPDWIGSWLHVVSLHKSEVRPVIMWDGGFLTLLTLSKWRDRDVWFLVSMSLIPVTPGWYEVLPLLLIPKTKRECQAAALMASVGYVLQGAFLTQYGTVPVDVTKPLIVAFGYLSTAMLILRRDSHHPGTI
jgi:hypothetical protein